MLHLSALGFETFQTSVRLLEIDFFKDLRCVIRHFDRQNGALVSGQFTKLPIIYKVLIIEDILSNLKNYFDTLLYNQVTYGPKRFFTRKKQFVYNMFANRNVFDVQFHAFWGVGSQGSQGFVPTPDTCPNAPGVGTPDYQCCGGGQNPFLLYNANNKKCCSDGTSVVRNNESCPYQGTRQNEHLLKKPTTT